MKTISVTLVGTGAALFLLGLQDLPVPNGVGVYVNAAPDAPAVDAAWSPETDQELIEQYCVRCHNERRLRGNLTLEGFDASAPHLAGDIAEKMIVKLRAGMMPPPGVSRPAGDSLQALAASLEGRIDDVAARVWGSTEQAAKAVRLRLPNSISGLQLVC